MAIFQWNVRIEVPDGAILPADFDFDLLSDDLFKFIHGTLIPKYEMVAKNKFEVKPFTYEQHVSTQFDACPSCIRTAQDGES